MRVTVVPQRPARRIDAGISSNSTLLVPTSYTAGTTLSLPALIAPSITGEALIRVEVCTIALVRVTVAGSLLPDR